MLHDAQKLVVLDNHRFRVVVCGRKWGKTEGAIQEMFDMGFSSDDRQIAYLASNYGEARDICWERLKKKASSAILGEPNATRLELRMRTQDGGASVIQLKGWESVENLRGREFDFLVLDEIQNYKDFFLYWQEVLRPTLIKRKGTALFMGTPKGFNHVYDLYQLELSDPDYKSFHFTSYDNPVLPREEIDKMKNQMTPDRFAQEVMAQFVRTEGLVFKEFSRERHIYRSHEEEPQFTEEIAGVDFGFTNPAAVVHIGVDRNGRYWIHDEYYRIGKTDAEVAEYVAANKFNKVYPDPESPGAIKEMTNRGVNVREVIKGKDSIVKGINSVREAFKADKVKIFGGCQNLIAELDRYVYPESKEGKHLPELPVDDHNHLIDAMRYAMMMNTTQGSMSAVQRPSSFKGYNRHYSTKLL